MMKSVAIFFVAGGLLLTSIGALVLAQDENQAEPAAEVDVTTLPENPNPPVPPPEAAAVPPAEPSAVQEPVVETPAAAPEQVEPAAPLDQAPEETARSRAGNGVALPPAPTAAETTPTPAVEEPAKNETEAVTITPVAVPATAPSEPPVPAATPEATPIEAPVETTIPAVVEPVPEPAVVEPAPEPAVVEPAAEPAVAEPVPEPAVVEPAPEPETIEPTPEAVVEKPEAPTALPPAGAEVATQATAEAVAPVPSPEKPAVEGEEEIVFELERGAVSAAPEKPSEVVEEAVTAEPKASLWRRLVGRAPRAALEAEKAVTGAVTAAGAPEKMLTQEELLAAQEEVRRQAREVEALKALDLGYQAMGRNEFDAALKHFNQALNLMPIRPHTVETRQKAMQSQAECEYRIALNYYKAGQYDDAKKAIRRALEYYPAHQRVARLSEEIKKEEARIVDSKAVPTPPRLAAEYLDRQKQVKTAIERGRQYYAIGEYEKARREFRNVLALDEKNEEAAAQLKKLAAKMYNLETGQMDRQQAEMIAQVRDAWSSRVRPETVGPEAVAPGPEPVRLGKRRLLEKLNSIQIPKLEFRQANIVDVIKYLDEVSLVNDKESPPGEKGVNFILHLKRPGAAEAAPSAPVAPAEGELLGEEAAVAAPMPTTLPTVTLSLRNIVLMDAIKYITEVTGLKYRIEENVVIITPSDVVTEALITRTYKVQPSIAETIIGAAEGAAQATPEFGGPAPTVERGDVKKFFVDAGVPFPQDTSIVYKPSLNLLIVKNTAENLENFERILNSINDVPVQVEIEARFVEVAQSDLEELGLEWLLTDNWELAENASASAPLQLSARERVQMNKNAFSKGLRNLALGASGISATPGGDMAGVISISSVLTNPEMTMILHALEQRSGANLLSAPKVTTKSGANAEIKVVRELIYPTEFTVTQPQVSGSGAGSLAVVGQAIVTPAGFEKRDTGVVLNVTPTVGPDGFSIDLVMLPQVVELADWVNYGSSSTDAQGRLQVWNMPQPIFHTRTITTGITIWDGQTVVMGGLITEAQTTTQDKVPVLGDIPLLGALFRSKSNISRKFNLLIFVTANLVDPAGNKINKEIVASVAGGAAAAAAAAPATAP
ncbi:MAG: tetratricopeptide repeat protein [Lentisphaerae bacterium]|nr:tetratricopeptide repeat protein [Lentisphaerota bacterium]